MKIAHRSLTVIPCFTMLVLLASCATVRPLPYIPNDSTTQNMSAEQARKALVATWVNQEKTYHVRLTPNRLSVAYNPNMYPNRLSVAHYDIRIMFSELPQISASGRDILLTSKDGKESRLRLSTGDVSNTKRVADALYVLKQNAINDIHEYDASFAASLADYRKKAAANTTLPEEANKYKVQAEGAVRDKEFDDAADLYTAALKIAPWWPVGHFNRALVLGEAGDYELAKREMNYYLQLVPNAPNARAAQDKIYEWERLESKQGNK